ncbi:2Fe-2S iron-sulfur cluster-binding protein [Sphingorhabdus buctiana]|jgi:2Fe-2S ferredoxin|uniref:2Fe-2S iron-sulfur cluster binding domain-containing protein n=4 Tax=Sphingomonadaceae TaxID=41297 RepID=A0A7Y0GD26_9SPHN|nr:MULTISPECIES: 2Fe-2S iron-sulfur cluster-binding protein [Sphingomonadaceae]MBA4046789.1 2Fe-2S ferredoxin [Erythrobacter sp.]MBN8485080.1 2Fe-2S iron-sulfur cluster binding domain-containing protein [Sphingomonadales bacterium]MEA3262201.1 2Fe-2S iron-sulfur cluster-binding protein [Pseudomonadota bacterium]AYO75976.1 2Fe-2S ferredoxin [Sphingobium yanoikuyae]MCC6925251.1 2Fe-2S iron-sulfur cluster binding domain-containing protein [Novosphingobium sp.]
MINVTFVSADGTRRSVEIDEGLSAREAALFNSVPGIDGDCGGVCACATCHVHVDQAWMDRVGPPEEGGMESDLIQFAEGTTETSRLACQIPMVPELDGLVLHLPELQH